MFHHFTDDFAVAGQIDEAGLRAALDAGFKTIICNRPDTEDGAVPHNQLQEIAHAAGIGFIYHPVQSAVQTPMDAHLMAEALTEARANDATPVLAYCRSGARSGKVFEMAQPLL